MLFVVSIESKNALISVAKLINLSAQKVKSAHSNLFAVMAAI